MVKALLNLSLKSQKDAIKCQFLLKSASMAKIHEKLILLRGYQRKNLFLTKFNTFYKILLNFDTFSDCLCFQLKILWITIVLCLSEVNLALRAENLE